MKWIAQLALVFCSVTSLSVLAQTADFPHLVTTGYGEVEAQPDMAQFSVRVVETTMNAEQAKAAVDKVVAQFTDRLAESGVERKQIASSNLFVAPQYHYPQSGQPELVGYRASRNVTVEVGEIANLNQYLDIALAAGINQVDNIQLKVSDPAKYQMQARMAAIEDAKLKAQSVAKGFERHLGAIWQVEYNDANQQPVLMRSMNMSEKRAISDTYQDSVLTIRDRVQVIYRLEE
ncbi:oxidative stress defense protein [Vibrio sp. ABG19]|uniref:oxidative stress defense protein n=1 Tax=Vibrio sp. ABG19 TaxID=2817385 RepID=UPI00249E73C9|nr:oxidative stress defense protein [Vibrio sp. ABG19]WGY45959.1 oxidative stress defense protein [Vibrio sp. ABG19]